MGNIVFSSNQETPTTHLDDAYSEVDDDVEERHSSSPANSESEDDVETRSNQDSRESTSEISRRRHASVASDDSALNEEEAHVARMLSSHASEDTENGEADDENAQTDVDDQPDEGEQQDHTHTHNWNIEEDADDEFVPWRNLLFYVFGV